MTARPARRLRPGAFRPGPLRAAVALAVGFVAVRVVYRVLFHGVDGDGILLLDLPVLRLPPPLGHVQLLGPITAGGLWTAALSAVPVAAVIVAFGLLNATVDVPRLIGRGARSGPFRGIARALSIAWATLPALVDAARAARFAQRLRGDRAGVGVLAPVLERTLERATSVAAALELRGYAGRGLDGACERPVDLHGVTAGFGARDVVRIDGLSLAPGQLTVLSGPTGSGKSTLLRTLSGLHPHVDGGSVRGEIVVVGRDRIATPPRDTSRTVGVVLQHPREAFATERVADEIGLSLELRGVASVIRAARVREIAERVGITRLLGRRLRELSAGEATLVAIAAAIVEHPILLVVDEPLADLDAISRARIVALLGALAHEAGVCVVVAEHRAAEFAGVADRWLRVAAGTVDEADAATLGHDAAAGALGRGAPGRPTGDLGEAALRGRLPRPALTATGITVRHGARVAVADADVALAAGEIVAITGPNGAGKSSLLVALSREPGTALVPDASDDLFVRSSVAAECRRADRRASAPKGTTAQRFVALLGREPSTPDSRRLLAMHPRDLSAGERRCLAIALQTAARPAALLIDEPTRGLDPSARALVLSTIAAQADAGTAVLFATHDAEFAHALAHRALTMTDGVLDEALSVAAPVAASATLAPAGTGLAAPAPAADPAPPPLTASDAGGPASTHRRPASAPPRTAKRRRHVLAMTLANLAAAAAFFWPLVATAVPAQAQAAVPYIALALAPLAIAVVLATLDDSVRSAHTLALLAVLAALGAAIRVASTGVGGVEALFVLLILAGRAYGPRFGLLLGAASVAVSALMWGGVGPWLPFQMFACGWVGAGAGLLPRRARGWAEVVMLCLYGVAASYVFGLIMNMWFWPFAVGADTSISYVPGGWVGENLANFLVYSLLTSTATWDTLRAVTTVLGLVVVGRAVLSALRRAKPVTS